MRSEWKEIKKEKHWGIEWKKDRGSREAEIVCRDTQSLRGLNQFHFQSSCRSGFASQLILKKLKKVIDRSTGGGEKVMIIQRIWCKRAAFQPLWTLLNFMKSLKMIKLNFYERLGVSNPNLLFYFSKIELKFTFLF